VAIHLCGLPVGDTEVPDGPSIPRLGLAPDEVYRAAGITPDAGALLPHRFTLTCATGEPGAIGGLFSVARLRGHPRLALASVLPCGVPTFLDQRVSTSHRGHPANSPGMTLGEHAGTRPGVRGANTTICYSRSS